MGIMAFLKKKIYIFSYENIKHKVSLYLRSFNKTIIKDIEKIEREDVSKALSQINDINSILILTYNIKHNQETDKSLVIVDSTDESVNKKLEKIKQGLKSEESKLSLKRQLEKIKKSVKSEEELKLEKKIWKRKKNLFEKKSYKTFGKKDLKKKNNKKKMIILFFIKIFYLNLLKN